MLKFFCELALDMNEVISFTGIATSKAISTETFTLYLFNAASSDASYFRLGNTALKICKCSIGVFFEHPVVILLV